MRPKKSKKRMWITLIALGVLAIAMIVAGVLLNLADNDDPPPKSNGIDTPIDYFS